VKGLKLQAPLFTLEDVLLAMFKCPEEDYALLQRLRNQLVSLKIDYRGLEEAHQYSLKAKRFEVADFLSGAMKRRLEEIRVLEREIGSLESECFVKGK